MEYVACILVIRGPGYTIEINVNLQELRGELSIYILTFTLIGGMEVNH